MCFAPFIVNIVHPGVSLHVSFSRKLLIRINIASHCAGDVEFVSRGKMLYSSHF